MKQKAYVESVSPVAREGQIIKWKRLMAVKKEWLSASILTTRIGSRFPASPPWEPWWGTPVEDDRRRDAGTNLVFTCPIAPDQGDLPLRPHLQILIHEVAVTVFVTNGAAIFPESQNHAWAKARRLQANVNENHAKEPPGKGYGQPHVSAWGHGLD